MFYNLPVYLWASRSWGWESFCLWICREYFLDRYRICDSLPSSIPTHVRLGFFQGIPEFLHVLCQEFLGLIFSLIDVLISYLVSCTPEILSSISHILLVKLASVSPILFSRFSISRMSLVCVSCFYFHLQAKLYAFFTSFIVISCIFSRVSIVPL